MAREYHGGRDQPPKRYLRAAAAGDDSTQAFEPCTGGGRIRRDGAREHDPAGG